MNDYNPAIILIAPQMGENIGAAARSMLNFGLTDLRIVNPRDGWPNPKAVDMAKGAKSVIKSAQIFTSLKDATTDIKKLYATTARPRDLVKPVLTPRKTADEIIFNQNNKNKSAILFGCERSGLDNEAIAVSDAITIVPVSELYTSLNLAQAVTIMCYEWFVTQDATPDIISASKKSDLANKEDVVKLLEHLEGELDKSGFLRVKEKRPRMVNNIRGIFTRAQLTDQDVRTLRGIIRSLTDGNNA
ncbi:RNA methyltransferase [Rickettsiales bacterium]|nr:RNA methyltransferase [Rickettsiales bacterium]